ncbi:MAG: porin family protein [Muribaculaceae bacterium]|nr:porin family protein [Muribaculaceae bacterium]
MKKLFMMLVLICFSVQAYPQFASDRYSDTYEGDGWLQKGYRGFVEIGVGGDIADGYPSFFISTTHGYQFSEWIFAGAGLGYLYTQENEYDWSEPCSQNSMALYADARLTIPTRSRFYPYADLKLGGSFFGNSGTGIYFNAQLGARYAINENWGISLGWYTNVVPDDNANAPIMGVALGFDF